MKRAAINMATIAAAVLLAGCAQMRAHKGAVLDPQLAMVAMLIAARFMQK